METQFYTSKFWDIGFDDEKSMIHMVWKPETAAMTEDDYKNEIIESTRLIHKCKPKGMLCNNQFFFFTVTPELQEWTVSNSFNAGAEVGMKKVAIIIPEDFFAQLSLEQLMSEDGSLIYQTQFFPSEESALIWLSK